MILLRNSKPRRLRMSTVLEHENPRKSTAQVPLSDEMLERFQQRAPAYDRENRFFFEDF